MLTQLRRYLRLLLRSRRWSVFLAVGFLLFALGIVGLALFVIVAFPEHLVTLRSFHPMGLAMTAFSLLLIGGFWFLKGVNTAFQVLTIKDQEVSDRIRELVFRREVQGAPLPSLVAVGGGTGLSSLLKGLRDWPLELTAVVTVTDDGGSSGRLRKDMQILPPGDIRNCLVALSRSESLLARLFQFRFSEAGEFSGHSFGNLFIAAMTELLGDFGSAVREASNILAIEGHVIPVTCENVQLQATFEDHSQIVGETAITGAMRRITGISLVPPNALANPEALSAIDRARLIVLGPGSLFTSIIPNLLVPDVAERINRSRAEVVYVCNVMTQPGETDRFTAVDHVSAILKQTPLQRIDTVIVNSRRAARPIMVKYEEKGQHWVPPTVTRIEELGIRVISGNFLWETDLLRHDPTALGETLFSLVPSGEAMPAPAPAPGIGE